MVHQIITKIGAKIPKCECMLNYSFSNKLLCLEALNSNTYPIHFLGATHKIRKNDALAVLGDARMAASLCKEWWNSSTPRLTPVNWDTLRKDALNNVPLAILGRQTGLADCVVLNPGQTRDVNGYMASDRTVATAVEALFGAVYLDGGEEAMEAVLRGLGLFEHKLL
ncbi:ribonuclease III domain-containing protein [Paraphoma chrysanthemicola]|uniref:Ribonuclease III domain-containing protein n=1 Tax=Paraphoma chrysanthemicola TaxID=798071 RepID=A0A8K0W2Y3_9PLEO|nr:ribonuclease III domain-containing protein [Paraphoma chrysanthemicola]